MKCLGTCRHCSRRVREDEGRMNAGRAEHTDCIAACHRMDTARRVKGKPPVQNKPRTLPTSSANPHAVRSIDTHTGEVRYLAEYDPRTLDLIVASGNKRPRTWNETRSSRGGGHDRT